MPAAVKLWPGTPFPLGATYDGTGTNFAVFSDVAERVELCLFDADGTETRVDLPETTAQVWHGYVPTVGAGQRYGFRVHGPYEPSAGLRCNPAKLLLDPYATAVDGEVGLGRGDVHLPLRRPGRRRGQRRRQRAVHAQGRRHEPVLRLGQRPPAAHAAGTSRWSTRSTSRASRKRHPGIPEELRGTYAGSRTRRRSST